MPFKRLQTPRGKSATNVASLKAQLAARLAEPLMARGVSVRYPTSGSNIIVDDLLTQTGHGTLLGARTGKAWDDVEGLKGKQRKRKTIRST